LGFTVFAVFLFSVIALAIARTIPKYQRIPVADLAMDPHIVVGAQAAAYPVILVLILVLVRSRTHQRFRDAIHWNWPGVSAPGFFIAGSVLALIVEGLSSFLPIPKSLPMDNYFHNESSAYLLAAFGITLAPLLEELCLRIGHRCTGNGSSVCSYPWSTAWLCLESHTEHLRSWRGLHRNPRARRLSGSVVPHALRL